MTLLRARDTPFSVGGASCFGKAYLDWAERTPAFVPRLRGWTHPGLGFAWRTVFRREHNGFFLIVAVYTAIELIADSITAHRWYFEVSWLIFFVVGALGFLAVSQVKKRTRLLHTAGRCPSATWRNSPLTHLSV